MLYGLSLVSKSTSVILTGGKNTTGGDDIHPNKLFELSCFDETCTWEELPPVMKYGRNEHASIFIPDDFVFCSKP